MTSTRALVATAALVVFGAAGCHGPQEMTLDNWANNHPEASRELGTWVQNHPEAARLFFDWDSQHPDKSHEFVAWSVNHPQQPIATFIDLHPNWPVFDQIAANHRPAANAFMDWCRRHPPAAMALMNHPGGLAWAGHHLYASSWEMKSK